MTDRPTKQEIMREGLEEIRAENRLVAQRRAERESDFLEKLLSLPKGNGPFYSNRAMNRDMLRKLRYFGRRKDERVYKLSDEDRARMAIEARRAIPASSARRSNATSSQ